jgi:hypothetical protein
MGRIDLIFRFAIIFVLLFYQSELVLSSELSEITLMVVKSSNISQNAATTNKLEICNPNSTNSSRIISSENLPFNPEVNSTVNGPCILLKDVDNKSIFNEANIPVHPSQQSDLNLITGAAPVTQEMLLEQDKHGKKFSNNPIFFSLMLFAIIILTLNIFLIFLHKN